METMLKARVYKPVLFVAAAFAANCAFAQKLPKAPDAPKPIDYTFGFKTDDLNLNLNLDLKDIGVKLDKLAPQICMVVTDNAKSRLRLKHIVPNIHIDVKGLDNLNLDLNNITPQIDLELNVPDVQLQERSGH